MKDNIQFFTEETQTEPGNPDSLKAIVQQIVEDHGFALKGVHVITLSDKALKAINKEFLDHDYFTDVISFDLSESEAEVEGEIYVSVDRIQENADHYNVAFNDEFHRVVVHGALHLVGYTDSTDAEKNHMHSLENHYLALEKWYKRLENGTI